MLLTSPKVPVHVMVAFHPALVSASSEVNLNVREPSKAVELNIPGFAVPVNPLSVSGVENSFEPL